MKLSYIQLAGEKRPVCFSLSAIEEIMDEFGSLDKMKTELTGGNVRAINRVLEIMLDAGAAYCKGMGIDCPPKLQCRPGDLIGVGDTGVMTQIFEAIREDSERSVETQQGKN